MYIIREGDNCLQEKVGEDKTNPKGTDFDLGV